MFVYKIIHDLRHPTQALVIGLGNVIDNLQSNEDLFVGFSFHRMQYISQKLASRAFEALKKLSMRNQSRFKNLFAQDSKGSQLAS